MSATEATITFTLDERPVTLPAGSPRVLADALSGPCGRTGVRVACDHGMCGACAVLVDGKLATSCCTLVETVDGCSVTTVQGLQRPGGEPTAVQQAFVEEHGFQCGMCTAGMILLAEALLDRDPDPTPAAVRAWMGANLCRCTGYRSIEAAVLRAARLRKTQLGHGKEPWRAEQAAKVTGQAFFTVDLRLPDLAEAKLLRSPVAHARIRRIDVTAAAALPGVLVVLTGEDLKALPAPIYGLWIKDQPLLAQDIVRHVGDPVAAVAAIDARTALAALSLIEVDYEPLQTVATVEEALSEASPALFSTRSPGRVPAHGAGVTATAEPAHNVLYEFRHEMGDVEAAFAAADHIFEDEFAFSRMSHLHLEPLVTLARPMGEGIEIWSCNQDPFLLRQDIHEIFGLPEHRIRVHTMHIGGGFGAKSFCKVEPLAVLLALRAGAPVRLSLTMDESFFTLSQHAAVLRLTTAVSAEGELLARRSDIRLDGGAYADASALVADKAGYRIGGPYRWRALDSRSRAVRTNTVPAGSYRGFGGTQASWASESQIDMIARHLGFDPLAFRLRNLLSPGEPFRPGDSAIDCDLSAGLSTVAERLGWGTRSPASGPHRRRGKGLAIGFKDAGGQGRYAQARVKVTPSGEAIISCATVDMGQGASEVFRRIVARVLRLDPSRIARADIDTDQTAFDQGTHASAATAVTGEAVRRAALGVRDKVLAFAAGELGCAVEELDLVEGEIRRGNTAIPLRSLVLGSYGGLGAEFVADGEVRIASDARAALNAPIVYWMPNWVGAEVEVDMETGKVTVLRLVSAADAGSALVPEAVRGQIEGAAMQGLGQTLFEELVYRGAELANATPQAYRAPMATDLPEDFDAVVLEHGLGRGPFGAKGVGEAGILGVAAAVANAVEDAIGVRVTSLPLSPDRVLAAIDAARNNQENAS